jgi:hypothetical protein
MLSKITKLAGIEFGSLKAVAPVQIRSGLLVK